MEIKSQELRIYESKSIHTKLQSLGALLFDENRTNIASASNTFVKEGVSTSCRIKLSDKTEIRIVFSAKEGHQSGIELLK